MKICAAAEPGSVVLCMLPDTGERYLTTPLFEDIPVDMTADEIGISCSTPGCRFDVQATSEPAEAAPGARSQPAEAPAASAGTEAFLDEVIRDARQPVVLFALECCEFCWSVRKMFGQFGIDYRSVDLDSVAYQGGDRGGEIRRALNARNGIKTIPQVFVGGERVGGATDVFDAWRAGRLHALLDANGVDYDRAADTDPYTLLPGWLHKR